MQCVDLKKHAIMVEGITVSKMTYQKEDNIITIFEYERFYGNAFR